MRDRSWREDPSWKPWERYGRRGRAHGRKLRRGILKFILLKLLAELPRHGYDLIRAFHERGWGGGPGSVYPLLSFLEASGYVTSRDDGQRRTYEITEKGRKLLEERAADVAAFFDDAAKEEEPEPTDELRDALDRLIAAVKQLDPNSKPETIERVREIVDHARKDIYTLLAGE
ncbi:MAG TPA: PadR family transcriptional regulator [Candidatus Tyrphobacter sp.]